MLPLLLPLVLLFGNQFFSRKGLIVAWILFNLCLLLFFGIFHQGGVVPSLIYIQQESKNQNPPVFAGSLIDTELGLDVVYFKTFMPPRFLIAQPRSGQYPVRIHDPGRSETKLFDILTDLRSNVCKIEYNERKKYLRAIIVSPSLVSFPSFGDFVISEEPLKAFWPHFSSEDPPSCVSEFWSSSLRLYSLQFNCI